jgi:hypothetical protein
MTPRHPTPIFLLVALAALLPACATRGSVQVQPPNAGLLAQHAAPFDKVMTAARDALVESAFKIDSETIFEKTGWCFIAKQGLGAGTFGRAVRVILQPAQQQTSVWVVVESAVGGRAATTEEEALAREIQARIGKRIS